MYESTQPLERPEESPISALDRRLDLTRVSGEMLAWVGVILLGALPRLIERTTWPLASGEARLASDALALLRGGAVSSFGTARPLTTDLAALGMFLFGDSDGVARLIPALVGLGLILLPLALRHWLGRGAALAAGLLIALSPTLALAARRLDGAALLAAGMLLLVAVTVRQIGRPTTAGALGSGVVAALLLLVGPLGWVALPLAAVAALGITGRRMIPLRDLPLGLLGFLVTVVLVTTSLFVRPEGFTGFFGGSLRQLWDLHLSTLGAGLHLTPFVLILDELLAVALGLFSVWVIAARGERLPLGTTRPARAVLLWAALGVIVASLLGGKDAGVYVLAVTPLALLAGIGLAAIARTLDWREATSGRGLTYSLAVILAVAAAVSVFGLLGKDIGTNVFQWVFTLAAIVVLILVPLITLAIWLARHMHDAPAPLLGLGFTLVLAALALHTGILLGATNIERPGEPLLVGATSADIGPLVRQVRLVSNDLTTFQQSARDLGGGHGLTIVVDDSVAQPFAWYFRDFPNLVVVSSSDHPAAGASPQVIIARPDNAAAMVPAGAGYVERTFNLNVPRPPALADPDWGSIAAGAINPNRVRTFAAFLVDRQVTTPATPEQFTLALRGDVAQRLWGP